MKPAPSYDCVVCGAPTTPCYFISDTSKQECHGMQKDLLGFSEHRSPVRARVCAACGYIMFFAAEPAVFRGELERALRDNSDLPIPCEIEDHPDDLPVPARESP